MKKLLPVILMILALLLTACGGEISIRGEILSVYTDESTGFTCYTIRTERDGDLLVTLGENGFLIPWVEKMPDEAFSSEDFSGMFVTAYCERGKTRITLPNGTSAHAYPAEQIMVDALFFENAAQLSNGIPLNVTEHRFNARTCYSLADGTELLSVENPRGPENTFVIGCESFSDLSAAAQENVRAYYNAQGLLYDVQTELDRAYNAYLARDPEEEFHALHVGQEVVPTASNDRLMHFMTVVSRPISGGHMYEERLSAVFDRTTGEFIRTFDLFTCAEEEILPTLLDIAGITDTNLRAEIAAVFAPENIFFSADSIELWFTQGTLPSQEYTYGISLNYNEPVCALLHDWALPASK